MARFYNFFFYIVLFLLSAEVLSAQWDVRSSAFGPGVGTVQAIAAVRCGPDTVLLSGNTDGIFVDPTGRGIVGSWAPVLEGLQPGSRNITSIAVADSIVYISVQDNGVYATAFTPFDDVPCRPRWIHMNKGLGVSQVNKVIVYQNNVYAASDNGVWTMPVSADTSKTFAQNATTATWRKVEQNIPANRYFGENVLSLHGFEHYIFGGVFRKGAYSYNLLCESTTSSVCFWRTATPQFEYQSLSVHDITAADLDTIFPVQPSGSLPCRGVFLATGIGDNLFFAPVPKADSGIPVAIDIWYNISPSKFNQKYIQRINKVIAGDFPGSPATIIVGMEGGGLLISTDCGQTWLEANDAVNDAPTLAGSTIRTLAIVRDSLIFAAADGGPIMGRAFAQNTLGKLRQQAVSVTEASNGDSVVRKAELDFRLDRAGERGLIDLRLFEDESDIEIAAYNLLGNKVAEVYRGEGKVGRSSYEFSTAPLPTGMYICLARGRRFRLAEKFIISR